MTERIEDESARLRLLYDLGLAFAERLELADLTALVLAKCREVLAAEAAAVLLLDEARRELHFPYVADEDAQVAKRLMDIRFPADRGIAGEVLRSGQPLRVDDVAGDSRFYGGVDERSGLVTRNLICAPLRSRGGVIGVLQVLNCRDRATFDDSDLRFLDALAGSVAVAIENAGFHAQLQAQVAQLERAVHEHNELIAIRRELDVAREIQESILPRRFPAFPERAEIDLFATMVPAKEVGGDFYDFFFVDDDRVALVVGDVSGKGVPAALFMAVSRTLVKSVALEGVAPSACLARVNRLLCGDNEAEMFVSIFYALLDLRDGAVAYANGGHNRPFVVRGNGASEMLPSTNGTVLGVLDDLDYSEATTRLAPGESLFLYTDGVTEAFDVSGRMFGEDRLAQALAARANASAEVCVQGVVADVARFAGDAPQSDDVTALAVVLRGVKSEQR